MSRLGLALHYAAKGWPVFPLQVGGKRPLGRLAPKGLHDATADAEQVERWWRQEPKANIGLPTGHAFDVLDVDSPDALERLGEHLPLAEDPTADPFIVGPQAASPRGWHAYIAPTGLGNTVNVGGVAGVDWRGRGGYVVAPGSAKADGGAWTWLCGADDLEYGLDAPILPAPAWLLELRNPTAPKPPSLGASRVPAGVAGDRYVRTALDAECGRVAMAGEGTRNDALNRAAHALGQLVGAGRLDVGEAGDALLRAALLAGLAEAEAVATIRSGLAAGIRSPRAARNAR
ncbi:DNA primase [Acidimicrobiaceae bacterium USS-CC1]|uniref:DNA primase n=1 Tax=Acidiferrimicrobium australe TaxID=2664430 RepID=A0ABW9QRX7_9ACTN|nr:DNA primase [Acidiferrimicrobium australe]